ncbi:MAG TPA: fumarylacetoacetate hydrolase family protein [Solirubrobacteraceae bacterium]|nr:fumarylacetoacetate hydrolase family protein [Solirubrobacteraceae bacterium]
MTYVSPRDGRERAGALRDGAIHGVREPLIDLLARQGLASVVDPVEIVPQVDARLRAPVPSPPSIRDFMAFEEHVVTSMHAIGREVDPVWYEIPVFYFTNPAAVRGPRDPVEIAPGSAAFDYELEVAAVIGRPGANIPVAAAAEHIGGYTILCDWSARDLQELEMRVGLGPAKGKDTATSFGPWLVTPDELEDRRTGKAFDLAMTASVNGTEYSAGNLADLHWSFEQMISFASRGTELRAGDVIGSGTVGSGCILELSRVHGTESFPWLRPGDRVQVEVERLGSLESTIAPALPLDPQWP